MKTRFILTPIAATTMALGSSFAMAMSHDTKAPTAETRSSVPQITGQQQQQSGATQPGASGSTQTSPTPGVPGAPRVPGTPGASGTVAPGKDTAGATGTAGRSAMQAHQRSMDQNRASKIIGMDVVNRQGEKLGDVEDIVVDQRGNVTHAVVSTGGFLGIGERLHAIPWSSINRGNGENFVVDVDRDRLRNAPGFERNNWPNMTDQQWNQQNQRYFPRTASGTAAATGQRDTTTGMQRGTTGQTGAAGQASGTGATGQQTGSKAYGTDVDKDRMRQGTTGTGQQGTAGATGEQPGSKPYGTDVDKDRMRQGTTGTGTTGTTGGTGPGK